MQIRRVRISDPEDKNSRHFYLNNKEKRPQKVILNIHRTITKDLTNIHVNQVLEGKGKGGGHKKLTEEIMAENSSNLARGINLHIQEAE